MTDPLSAAAGVTGLIAFTAKISVLIASCIGDISSADENLLLLQEEVKALHLGLENVSSTFESKEMMELRRREPSLSEMLQSVKLLDSVKPLLADCRCTLEKLAAILAGIEGKSGSVSKLLGKPVKAIKIGLKSKGFEMLRREIRSYSSSMQLGLQMAGICLTIENKKQVEAIVPILDKKLSVLREQIKSLRSEIKEMSESAVLEGRNYDLDELQRQQHLVRVGDHINSAEELRHNASVYSASISGTIPEERDGDITNIAESVLGIDDYHRRQIAGWLPGDTDATGDMDIDFFLARLKIAREKMRVEEYEAAITHFQKCLKQSKLLKTLPAHVIMDTTLELAQAFVQTGRTSKERALLLKLINGELSELQRSHLQHRLATGYLLDLHLDKAFENASKAAKHRRKLLPPNHKSYLETVYLLREICKLQGNLDDARVYAQMLPADYVNEDNLISDVNIDSLKPLVKMGFAIEDEHSFFKALDWAAKKERVETMRLLLSRHLDGQGTGKGGFQRLHYASKWDFEDMAQILLKQGADVNAITATRECPIHIAAKNGNIRIIQLLLRHEANVNVYNKIGERPLSFAISQGHDEMTRILLKQIAKSNTPGDFPDQFLHMAAKKGLASTMQFLLEQGAHIDKKHSGNSPLHTATEEGHESVVRLLVEQGADIEKMDSFGRSPLHIAAGKGHVRIVQFLVEQGADIEKNSSGSSPLRSASEQGHVSTVRLLLEQGAKINTTNSCGDEPLHDAASMGRIPIIRLLLQKGGEIDTENRSGETPLFLAAQKGRPKTVQFLLKQGAKLKSKNGRKIALHAAIEGGHINIVQLLLEADADNITGKDRNSALIIAAKKGHTSLVQFLLKEGAEINAKEHDLGDTSLDAAVRWGHSDTMRFLLEHGAKFGNSPKYLLKLSAMSGHKKTVQILLELAADEFSQKAIDHAYLTARFCRQKETANLLKPRRSRLFYVRMPFRFLAFMRKIW